MTINLTLLIFMLTHALALIVAAFKLVWWASQMSTQLSSVVLTVGQLKEHLERGTGPTCREHAMEISRLREEVRELRAELSEQRQ